MEVSLSDKANQSTFAKIVGISQPTVHKHAKRLGLVPGQTYAEWILAYTDRLRKEASGRAHESDDSFLGLKKRKAELENTQLALALGKEMRLLVETSVAKASLDELLTNFQQELQNTGFALQERIESKFNIEIDDECLSDPIRDTAERVAKNARELGRGFISGSGTDGDPEADADCGVVSEES